MLRLIFFILIVANAALFAFHQGYFTSNAQGKHEPERVQAQINPGQIKLLPADAANAPAPAPDKQEKQETKPVECVEIGDFPLNQTKRVESRLASLGLNDKLKRIDTGEASSHMVYIPSLGSKEAAEKKVAELDRQGISTHYIMPDGGGNRWSISLGVFKSEQAAINLRAELARKGVKGIQIAPRGTTIDKARYQLRELEPAAMQSLDKLMSDFPGQKKQSCAQ